MFCGVRKSVPVIELTAEQKYVPLSRCVTGDSTSAPEGSWGTDDGTATLSLFIKLFCIVKHRF